MSGSTLRDPDGVVSGTRSLFQPLVGRHLLDIVIPSAAEPFTPIHRRREEGKGQGGLIANKGQRKQPCQGKVAIIPL